MNRYIADPENLKLMMNLLKSKEKQIAFETFHCFKVGSFIHLTPLNLFFLGCYLQNASFKLGPGALVSRPQFSDIWIMIHDQVRCKETESLHLHFVCGIIGSLECLFLRQYLQSKYPTRAFQEQVTFKPRYTKYTRYGLCVQSSLLAEETSLLLGLLWLDA